MEREVEYAVQWKSPASGRWHIAADTIGPRGFARNILKSRRQDHPANTYRLVRREITTEVVEEVS